MEPEPVEGRTEPRQTQPSSSYIVNLKQRMVPMTPLTAQDYKQQAWNLDDLFPAIDSDEVKTALAHVDDLLTEFGSWQPKLNAKINHSDFVAMLQAYEVLTDSVSRLGGFAYLSFYANTQNQEAQNFMAQIRQFQAESMNRTLFFELWWKNLDDETAVSLIEAAPDYRYWLQALRLQKPYTLSEPEERIINLKNANGRSAMVQLYNSITNRFEFNLEVDGDEKAMTRGELSTYYMSPEPALRKAAYQELYRVYEEDAPILGQIYQAIVRDWRSENMEVRSFASPISVRNLDNDIPDTAVNTLLDVVQKNAPLFHRYFRLKAASLGVEKLQRYHLYAPTAQTETTYSFNEGVTAVLEGLEAFHPRLAELAQRIFDEEHLDSEVRTGKESGAFCAPISPQLTPWVLQSYHGTPNDVATMAHELGHAIHFMLAEDKNVLSWLSSLPLMETASTFSELLIVDQLLAQDIDTETRQYLLFKQMDDAYATIGRQAYFCLFEREAHDAIHEGASSEALCDIYLDNLREQFGDAVEVSEDFRFEWLAIPHFYSTPFYVYAYAFGQLLALALYDQFKQEGDAFKPRFIEILAAGGSASPVEILEKANIDISSAEFWQGGFDVLEAWVEQLETLG